MENVILVVFLRTVNKAGSVVSKYTTFIIDNFSHNLADWGEVYKERFHQDIKTDIKAYGTGICDLCVVAPTKVILGNYIKDHSFRGT